MNINDRAKVISRLQPLLGDRLSTAGQVREAHARDVCHHKPCPPDAVAFPVSNEEVSQIVQCCAEYRTPIIPFGTGTGVEGGVVAVQGGICVDLGRMNKIERVSVKDWDATVQAGVTRGQLNRHLEDIRSGLMFPVDPGADASLGGMAATCASGSAAVRYGTMRDNVLGLTAILPDGRLVRTGGRARKSSAGYDLTGLLVGSEGTLGIITELVLRLVRVPEAVLAAVCSFADIDAAVNAAIEVVTSGVPIARLELLDEVQMGAVNRYSNLDYKVAPTLFFEFHGTPKSVIEQSPAVGAIVGRFGGEQFRWATHKEDRDRLWQARYDAYYASLAMRPGAVGYVTDVCVPISQLATAIQRTKDQLKTTRLPAPLFGHVGDGNFHVVFVIDPQSNEELREVQRLNERIVAAALDLGGTCSGEHGIGLGKIEALVQERGEAVAVMAAIKRVLDPHHIMNPGKVLKV
jgi:D-lactate dehydrogenase (cytochrome)